MSDKTTVIEPGQSWGINDRRYDGERLVEIVEHLGSHVRIRNRRRRWWISEKRLRRLGTYRGHRGPGVLPVYAGSRVGGCLNCPPGDHALPMNRPLAVGFGQVAVTVDDELRWCGDDEDKTVADAEQWALAEPGRDWRIEFTGALSEWLYQRQDDGWVLVWRGTGFA